MGNKYVLNHRREIVTEMNILFIIWFFCELTLAENVLFLCERVLAIALNTMSCVFQTII